MLLIAVCCCACFFVRVNNVCFVGVCVCLLSCAGGCVFLLVVGCVCSLNVLMFGLLYVFAFVCVCCVEVFLCLLVACVWLRFCLLLRIISYFVFVWCLFCVLFKGVVFLLSVSCAFIFSGLLLFVSGCECFIDVSWFAVFVCLFVFLCVLIFSMCLCLL